MSRTHNPSTWLSLVESAHSHRKIRPKEPQGFFAEVENRPRMLQGESNTASGDIHTGYSTLEKSLAGIFQQSGFMDMQPMQLH